MKPRFKNFNNNSEISRNKKIYDLFTLHGNLHDVSNIFQKYYGL